MKKFILVLFIFLTFGCEIHHQIPERIGIKTQAEYYFTVANIKQDFSEYISAKSLQNLMNQTIPSQSIIQQNIYNTEITETSKFKLYDYNPNNKTEPNISQKYIAEMKLQEIPINVGNYLDNMDFSTQLKEMTFESLPLSSCISIKPPPDKSADQSVGSRFAEKTKRFLSPPTTAKSLS